MSVQVLILGMVRTSCGLVSEACIGDRAGDVLLRTKFIIKIQMKRFGLLEKYGWKRVKNNLYSQKIYWISFWKKYHDSIWICIVVLWGMVRKQTLINVSFDTLDFDGKISKFHDFPFSLVAFYLSRLLLFHIIIAIIIIVIIISFFLFVFSFFLLFLFFLLLLLLFLFLYHNISYIKYR